MKLTLRLSPKQYAFVKSDCDETLFGGAAGGGKSYALVADALLYALRYAGSRQLLLRRTFPELRRSLIQTSLSLYPRRAARYLASQNRWEFVNGSSVEFGFCAAEGDVGIYQSAEYDCLRFDELTHFSEYQYLYLLSRLRGANGFPKQVKAATNPGSVGHAWVKRRFVEPAPPGERFCREGRSFLFVPAKVQDNRFLMESDPDYPRRLALLPELERRALLEGDWDLFAGQFFPEYRRDLHGMPPLQIPAGWRRFISIDWGYNDPCAVLWHAVSDAHVYTYRELYVRQMTASRVAAEICRLSAGEELDYAVASPDMWQTRGVDSVYGANIAESFSAAGLLMLRADNARMVGWQRVREYLSPAADGLPHWRFFPDLCPNLARELPALVYDEKRGEDAKDGDDHAPESLRYALMSRPSPSPAPAPAQNWLPYALRSPAPRGDGLVGW